MHIETADFPIFNLLFCTMKGILWAVMDTKQRFPGI